VLVLVLVIVIVIVIDEAPSFENVDNWDKNFKTMENTSIKRFNFLCFP